MVHGVTALHYAARNCYPTVAGLLLQAGVDVNQEDIQPYERPGMSALDYALEHQYEDIIAILDPVTEWRTNHTGKLRQARRGRRSLFAAHEGISDLSDDNDVLEPTLRDWDDGTRTLHQHQAVGLID